MNQIDLHTDRLIELCDQHRVKELYAFGSVLTNKFNEKSDIDLLIQFQQMELYDYPDNFMDLKKNWKNYFNGAST
jgi:predicted nucleotidyltransferase